MQHKITLFLEEDVYAFFLNHFPSADEGVPFWVRSFSPLFTRTLEELKGHFKREELYLLIDAFSETEKDFKDGTATLTDQCRGQIARNGLDQKWHVSAQDFLDKIDALTVFQTFCLKIWGKAFYQAGRSASSVAKIDRDLESHVKKLL